MSFFREFFGNRIISLRFGRPVTWPDSARYIFLGPFKKFAAAPTAIQELKHRITEEIDHISHAVLRQVFQNMVKRLRLCKWETGYIFNICYNCILLTYFFYNIFSSLYVHFLFVNLVTFGPLSTLMHVIKGLHKCILSVSERVIAPFYNTSLLL